MTSLERIVACRRAAAQVSHRHRHRHHNPTQRIQPDVNVIKSYNGILTAGEIYWFFFQSFKGVFICFKGEHKHLRLLNNLKYFKLLHFIWMCAMCSKTNKYENKFYTGYGRHQIDRSESPIRGRLSGGESNGQCQHGDLRRYQGAFGCQKGELSLATFAQMTVPPI